ncbi:hypothetical protein PABG_05499 [Paracoccidioides brasiliensis Pb03]|nr:hypothetical protein PABG_05499 [Paracoccidioides brasiliensis Pb03]ODH51658.1 hypothetical protein GX48_02123 [Paracoccidioides brasiliensis]
MGQVIEAPKFLEVDPKPVSAGRKVYATQIAVAKAKQSSVDDVVNKTHAIRQWMSNVEVVNTGKLAAVRAYFKLGYYK